MTHLLDAKSVVFDLLNAATWPTRTPTITWGPPTKGEDYNVQNGEHIFFAVSIMEIPDEGLYAPRGWREFFDIRVFVQVSQEGDDERAVETRADELYGVVVDVFNEGRRTHLNGTVDQLSGWTSERILTPYGQAGWQCQITCEQSCVKAVQSP